MSSNSECLNLLIEAEKNYLKKLDIIDSRLSPVWMKQLESVAFDFTELLQSIQNIIPLHKHMSKKLNNMDSGSELDSFLLKLIEDIKIPYQTYNEKYLHNMNQRQDILGNKSIQQFLDNMNKSHQENKVSLQTLLVAPLNYIHFYITFFNDQRSNFSEPVLAEANEVFKSLLHKSDSDSTDFDLLYPQIDYSQVVDIFDEKPVVNYKLEQISKSLISGTFICSELSKRILLILTTNSLIFCEEGNDTKSETKRYKQLYTPIEIEHVSMRAVQIERELVGEYNLQFCIQNLKTFTMKTNSKGERNIWLGMDADSNIKDNSASCWLLLKDIVKNNNAYQQTEARKLKRSSLKSIRTKDVFAFYMDQSGEISPLVSSDDESKSDNDYVNVKTQLSFESVDAANKNQPLSIYHFSSSSDSNHTKKMDQKSIPPPLPEKTSTPPIPLSKNHYLPLAISGTKSLPSRNQSLKSTPISSHPISATASVPYNASSTSFSNFRPHSTHQFTNNISKGNQHYKPLPQPCTQTNSNHPPSPPPKKKSFMKSVMSAMSSKTSSRSQKNRSKSSKQPDPVFVSGHHSSDMKNKSSASINQQVINTSSEPYNPTLKAAEPLPTFQHLTIPSSHQTPSGSYSPFLNHPAPSSFTSLSSLNQSNVTLTPPLSISSSPRSLTPVSLSHYKTSSSSSFEDLGTPPESPELITQGNMIKGVLYSNNTFKVFHWKDESWYEVEGYCILEVRQTFSNRACIAVHMNTSGQLYLNAWVLPDTFICRTNETDLSLSLHITNNQSALETYLFHCESKLEADRLNSLLEQMHKESIKMNNIISAMSTLRHSPPTMARTSSLAASNTTITLEELSKTLKLVMQCKCKLYVQNGSSKWSNFGSVHMKVSQQYTTKKMHISIESHKGSKTTQLINAMVQSRNVERLSQKRISFMMVDELQKTSVVYMIQVREENTGDKIFEYIKTINAENGW